MVGVVAEVTEVLTAGRLGLLMLRLANPRVLLDIKSKWTVLSSGKENEQSSKSLVTKFLDVLMLRGVVVLKRIHSGPLFICLQWEKLVPSSSKFQPSVHSNS